MTTWNVLAVFLAALAFGLSVSCSQQEYDVATGSTNHLALEMLIMGGAAGAACFATGFLPMLAPIFVGIAFGLWFKWYKADNSPADQMNEMVIAIIGVTTMMWLSPVMWGRPIDLVVSAILTVIAIAVIIAMAVIRDKLHRVVPPQYDQDRMVQSRVMLFGTISGLAAAILTVLF